jgi:hypothetical protein
VFIRSVVESGDEFKGFGPTAEAPRFATEARSVGRQEVTIQAEDALVGIGEVAAAFAGFSGVVAALGARSVAEWTPAFRFRFTNLLISSVGSALFAFVPIVLGLFPISTSAVWVWSSISLGSFSLIFLASAGRRGLRVIAIEPEGLSAWAGVVSGAAMALAAIFQLGNLAAWPIETGAPPFVAGILALMVLSGIQFILLALDSGPDGA